MSPGASTSPSIKTDWDNFSLNQESETLKKDVEDIVGSLTKLKMEIDRSIKRSNLLKTNIQKKEDTITQLADIIISILSLLSIRADRYQGMLLNILMCIGLFREPANMNGFVMPQSKMAGKG